MFISGKVHFIDSPTLQRMDQNANRAKRWQHAEKAQGQANESWLKWALENLFVGVEYVSQAKDGSVGDEILKIDLILHCSAGAIPIQVKSSETGAREFTKKNANWQGLIVIVGANKVAVLGELAKVLLPHGVGLKGELVEAVGLVNKLKPQRVINKRLAENVFGDRLDWLRMLGLVAIAGDQVRF